MIISGVFMVFDQKNIISISDFSKDDIEYILRLSEKMEPIARSKKQSNVLSGKILGMLFYEPSTRTRLSFEAAMKRLRRKYYWFCRSKC